MATKDELVGLAKQRELEGYRTMNKEELASALGVDPDAPLEGNEGNDGDGAADETSDETEGSTRRRDPVAEAYADVTKIELKNTEDESDAFYYRYIVPKDQYFGKKDHDRYINDVRQHCINRGLRPDGDVQFVGKENVGDSSVRLTFKVSAQDAVTAERFEVRHAHASEKDQHAMEAAMKEASDGGSDDDASQDEKEADL
jgi:hypothetical protein